MKYSILRLFLFATLSLGLGTGLALAQEKQDPGTQDRQIQREKPATPDTDKAKTMTVTGCLQKGDEAGEYSIKDDNGKEYGLRSTTVKLADHLNHKVTVTGEMMSREKEKSENENHQHMNVTNLKMVSSSCR